MQDKDLRYSVYIHEMPNGKRYVGATTNTKVRFKPDQYISNKAFYSDILKVGWKNIKHIIVKSDLSVTDASNLEMETIKKYNTTNAEFGYNVDKGGRLKQTKHREPPKWSKKVLMKMVDKEMTKRELAAELGCNYTVLVAVLSGTVRRIDLENKIRRYFGMREV